MREIANRERILRFMQALGAKARQNAKVYFTGGATALLMGWRDSTIDIDLRFEPELDELFRALPELKEELEINIELASPSDFIPPLPGWETRSSFIERHGKLDFYHYDLYSQALAKIERGHDQDLKDVESMLSDGLVEPVRLLSLFGSIEGELYKYPAIHPDSFKRAVDHAIGSFGPDHPAD